LADALKIRTVFSDDNFGVSAAVSVNVVDGFLHALHHFDATLEGAVLVLHRLGERRSKSEDFVQDRACVDLDAFVFEHVAYVGEEVSLHQIFVDEQRLHGVASGGIVALGVSDNFQRFIQVSVFVDVDVTDAFSVTHHWDVLTLRLNVADQVAGAARNDQIDVLLHGQQVAYLFAGGHLEEKRG
jgi:hypothetical protein